MTIVSSTPLWCSAWEALSKAKGSEAWRDGWTIPRTLLVETECEAGVPTNLVSVKCFGLMEPLPPSLGRYHRVGLRLGSPRSRP